MAAMDNAACFYRLVIHYSSVEPGFNSIHQEPRKIMVVFHKEFLLRKMVINYHRLPIERKAEA